MSKLINELETCPECPQYGAGFPVALVPLVTGDGVECPNCRRWWGSDESASPIAKVRAARRLAAKRGKCSRCGGRRLAQSVLAGKPCTRCCHIEGVQS